MPDKQIHPIGTASAPADYTLPDASELLLKGAFAHFDGTSAAGSFVPLLRIISDAGTTSIECPQDATIAAGASADASWFPHVAAAAAASSTTNAHWYIARRTSNLTMLAGVTDTIPWSDLHSSDSTLFSLSTFNHPNDQITVAREGVVLVQSWGLAGIAEPNFEMAIRNNSSNGVSTGTDEPSMHLNTLTALPGGQLAGPTSTSIQIPDAVPFGMTVQYTNYSGANHVLASAQSWGLWWPTGALSPF